jgi:hypothetical protein
MLKRFSAENLGVNPKLFSCNSANDEGEWALIRRGVASELRVGNRVALDAAIPAEQTPISDALIAELKAKPRQPEVPARPIQQRQSVSRPYRRVARMAW